MAVAEQAVPASTSDQSGDDAPVYLDRWITVPALDATAPALLTTMLYVKVPFAGALATLAVLFTVSWAH